MEGMDGVRLKAEGRQEERDWDQSGGVHGGDPQDDLESEVEVRPGGDGLGLRRQHSAGGERGGLGC